MPVVNDETGQAVVQSPLSVTQGGTGTDLSATGGTSQFVFQESVGADLTVRAAVSADIPATLAGKTLTTPTLTGPTVSTGDLTVTAGGLVISGATKGVKSYGRAVQEGEYTTPAFDASIFTGNGSMTWTVAAGDRTTFAYAIIGKTYLLSFQLSATTVGGTLNTALQIALPGGVTPSASSLQLFLYNDNAGGLTVGFVTIGAGITTITLQKLGLANWSAAADTTAVYGRLVIAIS